MTQRALFGYTMGMVSESWLGPGRQQRPASGRARSWLARLAPAGPPPVVLAPPTHQHRHRDVAVPEDLRSLRGPVTGTVRLDEWLPELPPSEAVYNLDEPGDRAACYRTVIREARTPAQLGLLNAGWLFELWPQLPLPQQVRAAWELQHPVLLHAGVSRQQAVS